MASFERNPEKPVRAAFYLFATIEIPVCARGHRLQSSPSISNRTCLQARFGWLFFLCPNFRVIDLTGFLRRHDGKSLEFKRDLSSPERFLRSVVAFANTSGGTILIGVEDGTRHVRGVSDPLVEEERVTNLIADSVSPQLVPDMELLRHRDRLVLAVRIYPSPRRLSFPQRRGAYSRCCMGA